LENAVALAFAVTPASGRPHGGAGATPGWQLSQAGLRQRGIREAPGRCHGDAGVAPKLTTKVPWRHPRRRDG